MSTEMIATNLELLKEDLIEHINDECADILDEFEDEEFADVVIDIARLLENEKVVNYSLTSCGGIKYYLIKVNNSHGGFVSVSDEDSDITGVSRTLFYPYWVEHCDCFAGLCSLAEMINEAWYQLKS